MSTIQEKMATSKKSGDHFTVAAQAIEDVKHLLDIIAKVRHRNLGRVYLSDSIERARELLGEAETHLRLMFEVDPEDGMRWTPPDD